MFVFTLFFGAKTVISVYFETIWKWLFNYYWNTIFKCACVCVCVCVCVLYIAGEPTREQYSLGSGNRRRFDNPWAVWVQNFFPWLHDWDRVGWSGSQFLHPPWHPPLSIGFIQFHKITKIASKNLRISSVSLQWSRYHFAKREHWTNLQYIYVVE